MVENERAAKEGHASPPIYYPGTFSRSEAKLITFDSRRSVENVNITRRKEGGLAIAGTVRDEAGKPVPEAFVVVHPCDMSGCLATAYTDAQGHYRIQGLGEGEFLFHVDAVHRGLAHTRVPIRLDKTTKKTEISFILHRERRSPANSLTRTAAIGTSPDTVELPLVPSSSPAARRGDSF